MTFRIFKISNLNVLKLYNIKNYKIIWLQSYVIIRLTTLLGFTQRQAI